MLANWAGLSEDCWLEYWLGLGGVVTKFPMASLTGLVVDWPWEVVLEVIGPCIIIQQANLDSVTWLCSKDFQGQEGRESPKEYFLSFSL